MQRRIVPVLMTCLVYFAVVSTALADTIYLPLTSNGSAPDLVAVENSATYHDDFDFYIVGEVRNTLKIPVYHVLVLVSFYDYDNHLLSTTRTFAFLQKTAPDQTNPFWMRVRNDVAITHVAFTVTYDTTYNQGEVQRYTVVSQHQEAKINGVIIRGTLRNDTPNVLTTPAIGATCYDANGAVLDTDVGFAADPNQRFILPNRTVAYATVGMQRPGLQCAQLVVQADGTISNIHVANSIKRSLDLPVFCLTEESRILHMSVPQWCGERKESGGMLRS